MKKFANMLISSYIPLLWILSFIEFIMFMLTDNTNNLICFCFVMIMLRIEIMDENKYH